MSSETPDKEKTAIAKTSNRQDYPNAINEMLSKMVRNWRNDGESEKSIQFYLERTIDFYKPNRRTAPDAPASEKQKASELPINTDTLGIPLSEIDTSQVEWLWPGRIPLGKITLLDGDPGTGKSLLATHLAACITTGQPIIPGNAPVKKGGVVVIALEDDASDTLKPRLLAAGGNPWKVLLLNTVHVVDIIKYRVQEHIFSLSRDLEALEDAIICMSAVLVIIDPLTAVLGHNVDASHDQDVREVLTPLTQLAARTGCAIVIIRHLNKGSSRNILYRGAGSIGIIAAARMGLIVACDPDDENKRILATTKNNLGKMVSNLTYQIVENEHGVPYIQWLGENSHTLKTLFGNTSMTRQQQEILRLLKENVTPLNPKHIAELTGQNYDGVRQSLVRMLKAGDLQSPARGLYTTTDHPSPTNEFSDDSNITSDTTVTTVTTVTNVTTTTAEIPTENNGTTIDSNP